MTRKPLTAKGAEKLRGELRRLKTEDRPRVIQAIAEARAHGDLSENAEPLQACYSVVKILKKFC